MSIASGLYTQYEAEEKPQQQSGPFGEEAARLREFLTRLTPSSILLSNETFTSTGPGEAAYLMLDIVRVLVALGCRSLLATHLHELAAWVEDEQVPGAFSLAATTREVPADGARRVVPTFRAERAPPAGHSHAQTVARDNGLLFEQIVESPNERGQLDRPVPPPADVPATGRRCGNERQAFWSDEAGLIPAVSRRLSAAILRKSHSTWMPCQNWSD